MNIKKHISGGKLFLREKMKYDYNCYFSLMSLSKEIIGKLFGHQALLLTKDILVNLFAGIAGYVHQLKKPKLKIETALTRGQLMPI